jgi:transglutaminase-like putative cysteine protease
MRIRILHTTRYAYDTPTRAILQLLRLTPRAYDGQHLHSWRIETDGDVSLRPEEDAFGNIVHLLQADRSAKALALQVEGEIETFDTAGVVRGAVERLPPAVYLRDTALTEADPAIRAFAREAAGEDGEALPRLHRLLAAVFTEVAFEAGATDAYTHARDAFAQKRGVCQDMAHIFIAAARSLGIPARYVSGHLARNDNLRQEAAHAWAEAYVEPLGWVAFDPANGVCATESYVRVAVALDYLGAAPVRGSVYGGGRERMEVTLSVTPTIIQSQGQSQA